MFQQTETQRKAAFESAGLNAEQQQGVIDGKGYTPSATETTPRYSRLTPTEDVPEVASYDSLYETNRQAELKRKGDEIAQVEKIFGEKLQREVAVEQEYGKRDMARSNTVSAMTGMTGAPEATTREGNADRRTKERVSLVESKVAAEKAAALSSIFGRIDANASRAAEIELSTKREDQQRLREETAKNALDNIVAFAQQGGVDWDKFSRSYRDDKDLQAEVSRSGKSLVELYELYTSAQPAPPKKTYTWRGDNLVVVEERADGTVGTQTFDGKELGIPKGTDFKTITDENTGKVYWYDLNAEREEGEAPTLQLLGKFGKVKGDEGSTITTITSDDKRTLLGAGLTDSDISTIEKDVSAHGLDAVLEGLDNEAQKRAVQKVYGAENKEQFLTKDYLKSMFTTKQLKDAAREAGFTAGGFLGMGVGDQGVADYLDYLDGIITQYRTANYSDQEILKMMK